MRPSSLSAPLCSSLARGLRWGAVCVVSGVWSGCLVAPPLSSAPIDQPKPPFFELRDALPADLVIVAQEDTLTLEVLRTYDPNDEESLYYAFYSPRLGLLDQGSLDPEEGSGPNYVNGLYKGVFLPYEGTSATYNPCDTRLEQFESDTVFFYLSDRPWESTGLTGVEPREDARTLTHAWFIDLSRSRANCDIF